MKLCDECKRQANEELTRSIPALEFAERKITEGPRHKIIGMLIKRSWYPFYYRVSSYVEFLKSVLGLWDAENPDATSCGPCEMCREPVPIGEGVYLGGGRGVHLEKCFKIYQKVTPEEQRLADKLTIKKEHERLKEAKDERRR